MTDRTCTAGVTEVLGSAGKLPDHGGHMDEDLERLSRDEMVAEIRRLRAGIREHRDSSGHQLCWHHPKLWSLVPGQASAAITVPAWPQFMRGCIKYRQSLDEQLPDATRADIEHD